MRFRTAGFTQARDVRKGAPSRQRAQSFNPRRLRNTLTGSEADMLRPMASQPEPAAAKIGAPRRWLRWVVVTAPLLALLTFGVVWTFAGMALRPFGYEHRTPEQGLRSVSPETAAFWGKGLHDPRRDFGIAYEDVEFPTEGDATLRGWWIPGQAGAVAGVVTVHGAGADRRDFLRHLPILHSAGYPVLMFDCREHGISDGNGRGVSFGIREHEDVSAAVRYAKTSLGLERVAVIGTSQGGASVLLAAAVDPAIDAVISINPFSDLRALIADVSGEVARGADHLGPLLDWVGWMTAWRVGALDTPSPIEAIPDIAPRPLLLAHGTADQVIPVSHTQDLHEAAPFAQLWIAEGATHAALFDTHRKEWKRRILRFLRTNLGMPTGD